MANFLAYLMLVFTFMPGNQYTASLGPATILSCINGNVTIVSCTAIASTDIGCHTFNTQFTACFIYNANEHFGIDVAVKNPIQQTTKYVGGLATKTRTELEDRYVLTKHAGVERGTSA